MSTPIPSVLFRTHRGIFLISHFFFCVYFSPCFGRRFYVVRGQVDKEWKAENGELESAIHSSGLLFGITDCMLNV